jgi:uncharacterized repeat protein (TIGR03803 family)
LFQARNSTFYRTTITGGANNDGTVFSVSIGLRTFVKHSLPPAKIGELITILGNDMTEVDCVSFNGVGAAFAVVSSTLITARVPAAATSGFVTVTTPTGALKSNV